MTIFDRLQLVITAITIVAVVYWKALHSFPYPEEWGLTEYLGAAVLTIVTLVCGAAVLAGAIIVGHWVVFGQ